jgi:hypothetical protein
MEQLEENLIGLFGGSGRRHQDLEALDVADFVLTGFRLKGTNFGVGEGHVGLFSKPVGLFPRKDQQFS